MSQHLAIDIGSSTTRLALLIREDNPARASWCEVTRFATPQCWVAGRLCWDIPALYEQIVAGLSETQHRFGQISTLGVDSFGVDYQLLDKTGNELDVCIGYRDPLTQATQQQLPPVDEEALFMSTGGYFPGLGTLHQLRARDKEMPGLLPQAGSFLSVADTINYRLSGQAVMERSQAATTLMYDVQRDIWQPEAVHLAGLRLEQMPAVVAAGHVLGPLRAEIASKTGLKHCLVVTVCSHDTGNVTAAFPPSMTAPAAFISCGTWAMIGTEQSHPLISPAAWQAGITNESSAPGRCHTLYNLPGMWFVQQLRRELAEGQPYADLLAAAWQVKDPGLRFDITDARFQVPGLLHYHLQHWAEQQGVVQLLTLPELLRIALASLIDAIAARVKQLSDLHAAPISTLRIAGGGSRDTQFVQQLANKTHCTLERGFHEATLLGNFYHQLCGVNLMDDDFHTLHPDFTPQIITPLNVSRCPQESSL